MQHVHFIGIGGSGLSAMATVLLERGYTVSGSDRQASTLTQQLSRAGAQVYLGHHPENVAGAQVVVRSSAVPDENVEVQAALAAGVPVLKRIDFLAQLMAGQQGIAVAGTHGKTTTTAMIAWMLFVLRQDPSFVIGGVSVNLGRNAGAGQGPFFVIEADEYDHMFLGLHPQIAVVTNVEHDHPDCYPTPQDFWHAFRDFVDRIEPDGVLLACGDDPGAAQLLVDALADGCRASSYGKQRAEYDYQARALALNEVGGFTFDAFHQDEVMAAPVRLQVPGEHNVLNALAALAVADLLALPLDEAAAALGEFRGTGRRFEVRGEVDGVTIIDDYAHHPTEIRATLAAARARFPDKEIWAVWQPHTYSRARTLFGDFLVAFGDADHLLVTEVYAAREAPPVGGFSARRFVQAMSAKGNLASPESFFVPSLEAARDFLLERLQPGDLVLVLSAGDAPQISDGLLQALPERKLSLARDE